MSANNGKHVLIKYLDHVLFRNLDPDKVKPSIRECSGWIYKENDKAILIVSDRPVKANAHERSVLCSGFLILKSSIIEMKFLE
jgi:hypothetical protein